MTTLLATVTRGDRVESTHAGTIVVANTDGDIVASAGNPDTFTYFRSSAKPFQAIPVIESGAADTFNFSEAELALCCASHIGSRSHQQLAASMLEKIGLGAEYLRCGFSMPRDLEERKRIARGESERSPLQCDCSGKHAGMLSVCRQRGYALDSYLSPEHPLQRQILHLVAEAGQVDQGSIAIAADGCSVPTFGIPMAACARSYALLASPATLQSEYPHARALNRLRQAMSAYPENVEGPGQFSTDLMAASRGSVVAKLGAEGMLCLALPDQRLGVAIRIADGSFRSHPAIVYQLLRDLDIMDTLSIESLAEAHPTTVLNHNDWHVGDIRPVFNLR